MLANQLLSECQKLSNRIDRISRRAQAAEDDELKGELARYLCILLASLIDKRCGKCAVEFVMRRSAPTAAEFVSNRVRREPKVAFEHIRRLFSELDADRARRWAAGLPDDERDALDSLRNIRNQLAHGGFVGLSLGQLIDYRARADRALGALLERFEDH